MTFYEQWLDSIIKQICEYKNGQQTDLVLFRNHLNLLSEEIERSPEYKHQLSLCID